MKPWHKNMIQCGMAGCSALLLKHPYNRKYCSPGHAGRAYYQRRKIKLKRGTI